MTTDLPNVSCCLYTPDNFQVCQQCCQLIYLQYKLTAARARVTRRDARRRRCRCRVPVERALKDAKLDLNQLEEVILVGGSTRIPAVIDLVRPA